MARDGLARFCTVPYQHPNQRNIHSAYMHLTNYSLNKRSRNYLHTESEVGLLATVLLLTTRHGPTLSADIVGCQKRWPTVSAPQLLQMFMLEWTLDKPAKREQPRYGYGAANLLNYNGHELSQSDHCLLWKTLATFVYSTVDSGVTSARARGRVVCRRTVRSGRYAECSDD